MLTVAAYRYRICELDLPCEFGVAVGWWGGVPIAKHKPLMFLFPALQVLFFLDIIAFLFVSAGFFWE